MFSGCWYLAISLSIESLSKIKSPVAAGGNRVHRKKKTEREAETVRQQWKQWSKLIEKLTAVEMEMVME